MAPRPKSISTISVVASVVLLLAISVKLVPAMLVGAVLAIAMVLVVVEVVVEVVVVVGGDGRVRTMMFEVVRSPWIISASCILPSARPILVATSAAASDA